MNETVSFVKLKCLNCGANLNISDKIFDFACQYCGANQIVNRVGGIVALELLSGKIDRVQNSVDKTAIELKIVRYKNDLEELEEKHNKLNESAVGMKSMINPIAITIMVCVFIPFLIVSANVGSGIPLVLAGIIAFVIFIFWRKKINKIDSEFERTSKAMIEKGVQLKKKIIELEKIAEN
ncbi:MAG TPA: hypothetical protein PKE69_19925 [Pyrinomonadaceae bacterium]|nr:hypothetical protein [Pyrinomonadaceae bacterium]